MSSVLALKYRPIDFSEVVGQEQVVKQLQGALENKSLGHALLFSGTRGTGKTTTARIIARALNPSIKEEQLHLVCSEIDAASNNGVDDVRQIIENIRYSVQGHRVIILDEAHALSKNAWNALLKTLEEPPENTTFIIITTEPNKIIPTIKSRCQVYEFKDVDLDDLKQHYRIVADTEALEVSDKEIEEIALRAEGSVRDGLSLLQKRLSGEEIANRSTEYFDLVGAIYSSDTIRALEITNGLKKTEDAKTIVQTLERWFYWFSLEFFGSKTPIRPFIDDNFAKALDLKKLQDLFSICLEIERDLSYTPNSKMVLDMGVLRLCQ